MTVANVALINGQSNSLAFGTTGHAFPGWVASERIKIWSVLHQAFETYTPGAHEDWPGVWGPEAQYVLERAAAAPDEHFFIHKRVSGAIMNMTPYAGSTEWPLWMIQIVSSLPLLIAAGYVIKPDVFLLVGGETDAVSWPSGSGLLRYNLSSILSATRVALGAPSMRAVISRCYPFWDQPGLVRAGQVAIGSEPGNRWADVDNVSKADPGHSDMLGTIEVGHRLFLADSV